MNLIKKYIPHFLFVFAILALLYFSFENLEESPAIWMDEGIIIQTARNFSVSDIPGIRIDPDTVVSAGYVTTSYPVTLPIANIFSIFGISLFNARIVMAIFILLLVFSSLFWFRKNITSNVWIIIISFILIITFPPLYGHGKNVLGEVPGLFFLFTSMISLEYAYNSYFNSLYSPRKKIIFTIITCVLFGLTIVTKPTFIVLIPAIFIVLLFHIIKYRSFIYNYRKDSIIIFISGIISFLLPIIFWISFQFHGETIKEILSIYANPHSTDVIESIFINLKRFIIEGQPIYTFLMTIVWTFVLFIRMKRREMVKASELILYLFSILIFLAYLRTIGYYRYFFLGEFITLVMLVPNLYYLAYRNIYKIICTIIIIIFIGIQSYQLIYTGWTAQYRDSNQSHLLEEFIGQISKDKEIFIYQAPELITFIKHENYSQFMDITQTIRVGSTSIDRLKERLPDIIATNSQYIDIVKKFGGNTYTEYNLIGKYQFFYKE